MIPKIIHYYWYGNTCRIVPRMPFTRNEGIRETLKWMSSFEAINFVVRFTMRLRNVYKKYFS